MRAVHYLRTRQEERELTYWLSFVAYEYRDRSLTNRIYLLYLIIFFSGWLFITMTLFASGGAVFLRLMNPADTAQAALDLEVGALIAWSLYGLWQSLKRCPVTFSQQDAALLCQTPAPRRSVSLRWLLMPWFKSAVLFSLLSIILGFSYAETILPEFTGFDRVLEYSGYGLRSLVVVVPVHLALLTFQWVYGIYRLQKDHDRRWLVWPVVFVFLAFGAFLLISMMDISNPLRNILDDFGLFSFPLHAGFGFGSLSSSLLTGWILAGVMLAIMVWISADFSLLRAAQETQEYEIVSSMRRYGLTMDAANVQTQRNLGVSRVASRLPAPPGAGILIWKDLLQSQRTFRLRSLFDWLIIFSLMFGLALLPDIGSRALAAAFWVVRVGNLSVKRLRNDLFSWHILRQLPISYRKLILSELLPTYVLLVLVSELGAILGTLAFGDAQVRLLTLIPLLIAGIAGAAVFDVIRRSKSNLLMNRSVPEVSLLGTIFGLILAFIPLLLITLLSGVPGWIFAILISSSLGILAFILSVRAYRNIDAV